MLDRKKVFSFFVLLFFAGATLSTYYSEISYFRSNRSYFLGQLSATLGLSALSLQFLISARIKLIEKDIGYLNLLIFHRFLGLMGLTLITLHPLLLYQRQILETKDYFAIIRTYTPYHYLGLASLLLFLLTIFFAFFDRKLKIKYEFWRMLHKATYPAMIMAFYHSLNLGSNIQNLAKPLYYWWLSLVLIVLFSFAYRYFLRRKYLYRIEKIRKEARGVYTIFLQPVSDKTIKYNEGQFAFITFLSNNIDKEEHHFTISSSPIEKNLMFTIKESGDFTSKIKYLKKGDLAIVDGPYGNLTLPDRKSTYLFIAGGIGITPIRSIIKGLSATNFPKPLTLIYVCKTLEDAVFFKEFINFKKRFNNFKFSLFLTEEKNKNHYFGRPTEKLILKEIRRLKDPHVFIVGPRNMNNEIRNLLIKNGVKKKKLLTENFFLK